MKKTALMLALLLCLVSPGRAETLDIAPSPQQLPHWCWAAVSEMVFRYYGIAAINPIDYQCGIVALSYPICNVNCFACDITAPNIGIFRNVLTNYPQVARNLTGGFGASISVVPNLSPLTKAGVRTEIDAGRPIVAGVSPSGFSIGGQPQHATLIVGYEDDDSDLLLIVNDPFPYDLSRFAALTNPYIAHGADLVLPGQYRIAYSVFRDALRWTQSISRIRCSGPTCPQ